MLTRIAILMGLLAGAIWSTYFGPGFFASIFYIMTLIVYYRSKDEALWLVFFFVLSDGFIGFFNKYEAVISVIPGLPPIEVGHFYVIMTVIKAYRGKSDNVPFYETLLKIMAIYILFLVAQSYTMGLSLEINVQFRIVKHILPLLLFYSIPRLFDNEQHYRDLFLLLVPFAFIALGAQVFTLMTGAAPSQLLGLQRDLWFLKTAEAGKTYRGFYSTTAVLLSCFGALYYGAVKTNEINKPLLFSVGAADYLSAFSSATRGWVLCFTFVVIMYLIFVLKLGARSVGGIVVTSVIAMVILSSIPVVNKQFTNAYERVLTLEALAGGDVSAGGTLTRLHKHGPKVMKRWAESPLTGWGFSNVFLKEANFHVGNQTILMHSGILGAFIMALFFGVFNLQIVQRSMSLPHINPVKSALLVIPIFFMGWFIIHSTSGQQFAFYSEPGGAMAQAAFFSFAALVYKNAVLGDTPISQPA